ncbi:hypothetical protein F5888DRAFT_1125764 [Russula emetica]|nr:hypothetical protein F5888DRAFT_1125764 [Russula emetica]
MKTEGNGNDSILLYPKALLSPIEELDEVEVLERHTSLDRDSGSSCAEVAKTVADPSFPGPVVSDDDRRGLSQRKHTPDAPPICTPSSPQLPRITLPRFSPSPLGIDKMLERRLALSEPGNDHSNSEVGSRSRHKSIDVEAGTSSSRLALGSLPSRLRTSVDQGTSMRARRRRRDPVPQSSNVTSARSDLASEAFLSSSDDSPITTSRSSGLPLSQVSNLPDVSLARKDAKTLAVKRIPKSIPRPPPSRLVPELLDPAFVQPDEVSLDEDDPPWASGEARKVRRPNDYCTSSRPRDTSSPDCFLSGDSVSSFGRAALEGQDHNFEDFFIPPDCPTSTPVASRKRASRKCSAGSGAASASVDPSLATTRVIEATRH